MENQKDTTMTECLSGGTGWTEIQEEKAWDDFLAWCREQENVAHE